MNKNLERTFKNLALPIFEILPNTEDENFGVNQISLVDSPAISENWLHFSKDEQKTLLKFSTVAEDQRIVAGAFMIPDLPIYKNIEGGIYVYFSADTIKIINNKFFEKGYLKNFNLNHSEDKNSVGAYIVESWLINNPYKDKSATLGFNLPQGTWFGLVKITDDNIWNDYIKTGELKGFSVELLNPALQLINFKSEKFVEIDPLEEIKNLIIKM